MTHDPHRAEPPRQRRAPLFEAPPPGASFAETFPAMGGVRAVRRGVAIVLWTLPSAVLQMVLLRLPGRAKARFARVYWRQVSRLLGMQIRVVGVPAQPPPGRAVVFAANHSSWLDIPVLGGALRGRFVAKSEIDGWPVINTIARLGRTVFVSRGRNTLGEERGAMAALLAAGDNLILFPEGTSSDGTRVLPFRSTFFSIAEGAQPRPPIVQPVSVVYDQLAWLPVGRASRPVFAWYGGMELAPHYWQLAQRTGLRATVVLHEPIDPAPTASKPGLSRKQIAELTWNACAAGAATLRQNRPARPLRPEPVA